jgi:hypothetical protein
MTVMGCFPAGQLLVLDEVAIIAGFSAFSVDKCAAEKDYRTTGLRMFEHIARAFLLWLAGWSTPEVL